MHFSASVVEMSVSQSFAPVPEGNRLAEKSGHIHCARGRHAAGGNAHQMRCHTSCRKAEAFRQAKFSLAAILFPQSEEAGWEQNVESYTRSSCMTGAIEKRQEVQFLA